ncbi:MAG: N-acetylmuramoyl-L-alanine amidase [Desulfobulbaceae bacterium]|nr:N-acetylmuramoyl-L-alanine amidase [Desulfobulbaceae bacterium]
MWRYLHSNLLPRLGLTLLLTLALLASPPYSFSAQSKDKSVTKAYSLAQARCNTLEFSQTLAANRENWLLCAQGFQRAYQLDPYHPAAPNILFNQAALYRQMYNKFNNRDDLNEALSFYDDIVTLFPQQALADDALYQAATIHEKELKDPKSAALLLAKLIAVYPKGDMYEQGAADLTRVKSALFATTSAPTANQPAPSPGEKTTPSATASAPESRMLGRTEVVNVRHWSTRNYTRVVIETSAPVTYEGHLLKKDAGNSKRLYVDLQKCAISRDLQQAVPIKDGLLQRMRSAQFDPETVRVVLDTLVIADYKIFSLDDPFRIIIDVKGNPASASPPPPLPPTNHPPPVIAQESGSSTPPPTLAQQLGLGIKRVVLDPGHGGKDPGAIGLNGLREKDIVLNVAKKVARKISSQLGIEVVLTRKTDIFIPLEERTAIANTKNGDLFISIHANAAKSSDAQGIETYYLDLAANEADRGLAALENASSTRQISDLQNILRSLMQNSKKDESARLAGTVQAQLVSGLSRSYCDINNHGIKTAPFIVLIGAQMPSILTEIAFISNPLENQRLQDDKYLEDLADHITAGVAAYSSSLTMARL